jgi:hypothetical protein
MKLLRIVRGDNKEENIKFFEISEKCSVKEFSSVVQYLFGNDSTVHAVQILSNSHGKRVYFDELTSGCTYFLTFDKRSSKALLSWDSSSVDFVPLTNSSRLRVIDESEYYSSKIEDLKLRCKDKATELLVRQENSLMTLKQELNSISSTLGSQSLRVLEFSAKSKAILDQISVLAPQLQENIKEMRKNNEDLSRLFKETLPESSKRKQLIDPKLMNYMKRHNYKDFPMNELTPAELRRFSKFQFKNEHRISYSASQNTPSSKLNKF